EIIMGDQMFLVLVVYDIYNTVPKSPAKYAFPEITQPICHPPPLAHECARGLRFDCAWRMIAILDAVHSRHLQRRSASRAAGVLIRVFHAEDRER
ncbi:MAG: hypothetical protein KA191_14665, partial [Verrucomicrobia bacterium]|nr:hypothetical protein [Verrucomicrobiota bacterium]